VAVGRAGDDEITWANTLLNEMVRINNDWMKITNLFTALWFLD
jgi:hypothetical protein